MAAVATDLHSLPARLQWTLEWQTRHLMPLLAQEGAEARLRAFWQSARRMEIVVSRVKLQDSAICVDVGGGLTTPLRWLPGRAVCVDPLSELYAARFSLPTDRVVYTTGAGEALPLESETVDLAICTNCIDHTEEPRRVIAEVLRVLRPGGWFWFTCESIPGERKRNAGHPHALDEAAIHALTSGFEEVIAWEEPWRGIRGHLTDSADYRGVELGFLLQKQGAVHGG